MSDSILNSTKKALGLGEEYEAFDADITMHVNSTFSKLHQLGIGPIIGFMIEDSQPTWEDFIGTDVRLNSVKSYMYISVRLLFDPPATSYHISALQEEKKELEWRLNVVKEGDNWVPPVTIYEPSDGILDGGEA